MRLADPVRPAPLAYTGVLDTDAAVLARCVARSDSIVAALPPRPERNADEQQQAARALTTARAARHGFLAHHTDEVYDRLTDGRRRRLRLSDLMLVAADRFPGLTPGRHQLAAESARIQAEKEGYEIDQGILCAALMHSPITGRHLIDTMRTPTPRALELVTDFAATGRADLGTVLVERKAAAAHVTFRNAGCLNAEDNRLTADLETAVDLALLDDQVRVGVLRGGPVTHPRYRDRRVFSAGINLKDLRNGRISFVEFVLGRELGHVHKLFRGLLTGPDADQSVQKPWIGAVDTFAIGGGMQLLLVLDHVVAESTAYFSLPAAEEGIVPGLANLRLTRALGSRLARQVILGGRRIDATAPEARLICDETVPAAELDGAVERAVQRLGSPAVTANRRMLNLAEEPTELYREYLAEFIPVQVARLYSDDVLARVERRWQKSQAG